MENTFTFQEYARFLHFLFSFMHIFCHYHIIDAINFPTRIYPIGRLDKMSEGLIFLTNDGDIVNDILRARYGHEKEYHVTVNQPIDDAFAKKMSSGVARRGSAKRGSGEISRNRVWLEQGCGRTLIDKLGSSLSLLADMVRADLEEEMRSWP